MLATKSDTPVHTSAATLGATVCRLLPVIHSITGCDSVSSFSGISKKTAFDAIKRNLEDLLDILDFGEAPISLESPCVEACIKFVCLLYDSKSKFINKLRHKLFTQKNVTGDKLPPTLDALILHLRRANFQCYIWKSACELPSPLQNGWNLVNLLLDKDKMLNLAVPDVIVELTRCNCKKGCKTQTCRKENLSCTESCSCNDKDDCENNYGVQTFEEDSTDDVDI